MTVVTTNHYMVIVVIIVIVICRDVPYTTLLDLTSSTKFKCNI